MNKFTASIVFIAMLLVCLVTVSLFIATQIAEAGATKFTVTMYRYECKLLHNSEHCPGSPTAKVKSIKRHESLFHIVFGDHPHGFRIITKRDPDVTDYELSCSECSF